MKTIKAAPGKLLQTTKSLEIFCTRNKNDDKHIIKVYAIKNNIKNDKRLKVYGAFLFDPRKNLSDI